MREFFNGSAITGHFYCCGGIVAGRGHCVPGEVKVETQIYRQGPKITAKNPVQRKFSYN